jgi:hypothetical protein
MADEQPRRKPPNAGAGRIKGSRNKVTIDVRRALAEVVEGNVGRLQESLDRVANGTKIPVLGKDGKPVIGADGQPLERYLVAPDPAKFVDLMSRLAEYCVPKLSRSELTGRDGQPIETRLTADEATLQHLRELGARLRSTGVSEALPAAAESPALQ